MFYISCYLLLTLTVWKSDSCKQYTKFSSYVLSKRGWKKNHVEKELYIQFNSILLSSQLLTPQRPIIELVKIIQAQLHNTHKQHTK